QSEANDGKITFTYHSFADGADWTAVPDAVALEVYRIVQESVSNAVRHSGASEINVNMTLNNRDLTVQVADNGTYKPADRKGIGLDSIKKRANAVNGVVTIDISDVGTLVALHVVLP
ncbi:MAG: sensor histidine kinase, partial [Muribaculaceae bacterium]|nr:sensor histidine kinase [Muribaculaceae bacterium]